jgi:ParB family transcriptional regulator, chromosome partitioning protein
MPKKSRDSLNNKGKIDVPTFDPNDVVLVEDKTSALYDERVENDYKESLVLNMMFAPDGVPQGVLKPLTGRRNSETGKIEIIDGRQRTKAAREANRRLKQRGFEPIWLPVWIKRANDQRAMGMLISANEHATEDSPINRAKKAQRYIDLGRDEKEVAVLLGMSESTVKNLLKLLDAPAVIRNAVDAGKITTSDAYRLSREEPDEAKKKLGELLEKAPRTPGKKRSKNAKKAREIVRGSKASEAKSEARAEKKAENAVAEAIAVWIETTWDEKGDWAGAPSEIPKLIRSGEWRKRRETEDAAE